MPANQTPFRVAIVPGVNPGKWTKAWSERRQTPIEVTPIDVADQRSALTDGRADVAFIRLPIDRDNLSVIRLYEEVTVVVVPAEHPISLFESVRLDDLEGEIIRDEALEDAIDLVVAGAGILVLPHSLARLHTRRDLAVRPVTDAPTTEIAVAWLSDGTTADIEEFVGIVRGRKPSSSRGPAPAPAEKVKPQSGSRAKRKLEPRRTRGGR
jgi:DNA-binding transcriptional LysR family regulator